MGVKVTFFGRKMQLQQSRFKVFAQRREPVCTQPGPDDPWPFQVRKSTQLAGFYLKRRAAADDTPQPSQDGSDVVLLNIAQKFQGQVHVFNSGPTNRARIVADCA
jgi:hypothetical protein